MTRASTKHASLRDYLHMIPATTSDLLSNSMFFGGGDSLGLIVLFTIRNIDIFQDDLTWIAYTRTSFLCTTLSRILLLNTDETRDCLNVQRLYGTSDWVLADGSVRLPRKLFIFNIFKTKSESKYLKTMLFNFDDNNIAVRYCLWMETRR